MAVLKGRKVNLLKIFLEYFRNYVLFVPLSSSTFRKASLRRGVIKVLNKFWFNFISLSILSGVVL